MTAWLETLADEAAAAAADEHAADIYADELAGIYS